MATTTLSTKKATELNAVTTATDSNLLLLHDGSELKKITFANLK